MAHAKTKPKKKKKPQKGGPDLSDIPRRTYNGKQISAGRKHPESTTCSANPDRGAKKTIAMRHAQKQLR